MSDSVRLQLVGDPRIEEAAVRYLTETKKWKEGEFRIETRGFSEDGASVVLWAIHGEDELASAPGGGKSLELHIDLKQARVVAEYHFQ